VANQAEAKAARWSTSSAEKFRWLARECFFNSIGTFKTCRPTMRLSAIWVPETGRRAAKVTRLTRNGH
jgi:hypothetical protein